MRKDLKRPRAAGKKPQEPQPPKGRPEEQKKSQNQQGQQPSVKQQSQEKLPPKGGQEGKESGEDKRPIPAELSRTRQTLKEIFDRADDVVMREVTIGHEAAVKGLIVFIDGLVDKKAVNDNIVAPLTVDVRIAPPNEEPLPDLLQWLKEHTIAISELKDVDNLDEALEAILGGDTLLFLEGVAKGIKMGTRGWANRGVQQTTTELVIRGSKEGFSETLRINTSLLRRRIKDPNLKFETIELGTRTKTAVTIVYIDGIINPGILTELKNRLKKIKTDSVLESQYVEEFIQDAPLSPFLTVAKSERPDTVAAKILEGRFAILVDGTPTVITAPTLFSEFFMSSEDYYGRSYFSTLNRWIRLLAFLTTTFLPALYVAVVTFHQEMLPTPLLITMVAAKEGTPFPTVVEAIIMGLAFEILREAGVRMPRAIGSALSIVGALILGDAAVNAGIVSAPIVIVTAITGIATFVFPYPDFTFSLIPIRAALTFAAAFFGIFGVMLGILVMLVHLVTLRSFGVPYMSPIAPAHYQDFKDLMIRAPWWALRTRPKVIGAQEPVRMPKGLAPSPPAPRVGETQGGGEQDEE